MSIKGNGWYKNYFICDICIAILLYRFYIDYMTDYLYARPSILEGIGRNIDLFGILNYYNTSPDADKIAIVSDYMAIYNDFYKAYQEVICQLAAKKNAA